MSSFQLPLQITPNTPASQSRLPIHVAFTAGQDVLVALWETGFVKLIDLRARLGPGKSKVADPLEVWSGLVLEADSAPKSYRQITAVRDVADGDELHLLALGSDQNSDGKDCISIIELKGWKVEGRFDVELPQRNGRLIPSERQVYWQAPDGEILSGTFTPHPSLLDFTHGV